MAIAITNAGINSSSGVLLSLTLGASIPSGAAIIVGVTEASTSLLGGSIADNAGTGNAYISQIGGDLNNLTANGFINIFGVANSGGAAAGKIITYTPAVPSTPKCLSAVYITGVSAVAFDTAAAAFAGGSSANPSVTSGSPANSNNFAVGFAAAKLTGGFTQATGGWSTPPNIENPGGTSINLFGGSLQTTGFGTTTYNPKFVNSTSWGACIIELIAAGGSTPTNITLTQQSWAWNKNLFSVNAKTKITLISQPWDWNTQLLNINSKIVFTFIQQSWHWNTQLLAINSKTFLTLIQKSWTWTGGLFSINSKTILTLIQKPWQWITQTLNLNARTNITFVQQSWRWVGNQFPNFGPIIAPLLKLMGLGK